MLVEMIVVLESNPAIGMLYTNYQVIDENGQVKGYSSRCKIPYSNKAQLLRGFMTFHFRLMHCFVYDQIGGFNLLFICTEDYNPCLKFLGSVRLFTC
jgi:hypothetical protein